MAGLAVLQVRDLRDGLFFAGGIGVALLVLWLASLGLIRGVRRFFPSRWPYLWRQGLANLYRPANQTVTVVLSLGFGATLLATLFLVQHNLLREFRFEGPGAQPNLVFFDIQADQQQGVVEAIRAAGLEPSAPVPIIPMRIRMVKGKPVRYSPADTLELDEPDSTRSDSTSIRGWAVRREYRSTWRDTLVHSEKVLEGKWWEGPGSATDAADVSLELDIARELGVTIGDTVVWDVQGALVPSVVRSIRQVDWARFEPNFFAVFRPGPLDRAPQTLVTLTRVTDAVATRGAAAERRRTVSERDVDRHRHDPGDVRADPGPGGPRHQVHGRVQPRYRDDRTDRRDRHDPVPAHPRGRAAPHPRRHAGSGAPRGVRRIPGPRRAARR